jgi:hypothetical protein
MIHNLFINELCTVPILSRKHSGGFKIIHHMIRISGYALGFVCICVAIVDRH